MSSSYRHFDRRIREWALQHFQPGAEILDVGPGRGKFSCLLPEYRAGMDCVEVFEPFVAKYNLPSLYRNVIVKNVLDFEFVPGAYDLVLLGDVIEHLTPDEAGGLLDRIHRAGAAAIVAVPYLLPQGIIEENPFEAHKQGDLTHERMTTLYPKLMPLCTDNKYGVYTSRMEILNNSLNDVQAPIEYHGTTPKASRGGSNPTILVLQNPGRVSAYYIRGLQLAARRIGVNLLPIDLEPLWLAEDQDKLRIGNVLIDFCLRHNISAVLGYAGTAVFSFPPAQLATGELIPFFSSLGIPQILLWTDHPHWIGNVSPTTAEHQALLSNPLCHHFVKSPSAARDLIEVLGWPASYAMPMAEEPELLADNRDVKPLYDVVAICGAIPALSPELNRFLTQDDPDPVEISRTFAGATTSTLVTRLNKEQDSIPDGARLTAFCETLVETRLQNLEKSIRECILLAGRAESEMLDAMARNPDCYLDVHRILWQLDGWKRTFHLRYLARQFKVRVFGSDCSGCDFVAGGWVDYREQSRAYATGRMAINISQAHDDEGVTHKPFQIVASNVPLLHNRRGGLDALFLPGEEMTVFSRPAEARESVAYLLRNPELRAEMVARARRRLDAEHTWAHRLRTMLDISIIRRAQRGVSSDIPGRTSTRRLGSVGQK